MNIESHQNFRRLSIPSRSAPAHTSEITPKREPRSSWKLTNDSVTRGSRPYGRPVEPLGPRTSALYLRKTYEPKECVDPHVLGFRMEASIQNKIKSYDRRGIDPKDIPAKMLSEHAITVTERQVREVLRKWTGFTGAR